MSIHFSLLSFLCSGVRSFVIITLQYFSAFCLPRSRRKHLCWNSDTLYLVVYLYNSTVSITVVCMKTKQFSDKTTHRQQAKHSVKTGFVWEWENRIPGLFQDFYIFKDSISSQFCITQRLNVHFFSQKRRNVKAHSISLILTPVIKAGTTAQIE